MFQSNCSIRKNKKGGGVSFLVLHNKCCTAWDFNLGHQKCWSIHYWEVCTFVKMSIIINAPNLILFCWSSKFNNWSFLVFYTTYLLQQGKILHELPQLFASLLLDPNPIIHGHCLETFARFAEETAHESVVSESLQDNVQLQEEVVNYLNQVIWMGLLYMGEE